MNKLDFVKKAVEGGWPFYCTNNFGCSVRKDDRLVDVFFVDYFTCACKCLSRDDGMKVVLNDILLDPKAWQAVGKVEKWHFGKSEDGADSVSVRVFAGVVYPIWKWNMHRMIDALAEGKSIEEFLATL